jgi:hypothetical protein
MQSPNSRANRPNRVPGSNPPSIQRSSAGLTRVPDLNDLLRLRRDPALGLSPIGLLSGSSNGALAFLRSSVWTHAGEATRTPVG